jgi:DNA polymerase III delta' subunit
MKKSSYRFEDILLQESPVKHLAGSFANGRISQTYLFTGMKSTGRFTTALAFASLLQCQNRKEKNGILDSCGSCDSCRRIAGNSHPDVHCITPEGYEIRIDQIRALHETAMLKPSMSDWLIFIIDPANRLNSFAANSLLKILEEAPSHVVFIMVAGSAGSVLPTILSRSEIVRFQVPSHQAAREKIAENKDAEFDQACKIYSLSEGRFAEALTLSEQDFSKLGFPSGLKESHVAFLKALEDFSTRIQEDFSAAEGLEDSLRLVSLLETETDPELKLARKAFSRALVMTQVLPASFALVYSGAFLEKLDYCKRTIRKIFDNLTSDAKKSYSSAMLKEIDSQINSALSSWVLQQSEELFSSLMNWYADALRYSASKDESLLLNLDRKDDIITLAEVEESCLLRSRISLLEESMYLLRRYVQPSLVVENVLTQIGGPEA